MYKPALPPRVPRTCHCFHSSSPVPCGWEEGWKGAPCSSDFCSWEDASKLDTRAAFWMLQFRPHLQRIMCMRAAAAAAVASVMSNSARPHRRQPTRLPHPWDSPGKNTGVGCHFLLQCMKVKSESEVAQSCPTLSDPMDCSLSGSSIHGSFQDAKLL